MPNRIEIAIVDPEHPELEPRNLFGVQTLTRPFFPEMCNKKRSKNKVKNVACNALMSSSTPEDRRPKTVD